MSEHKYNKISDEDLKNIELDILIEVDEFCKAHHISYFLSSGTLLGAIRHKGFIPWDDDADVMMPRPDFDRFVREYKSDKYILNYPGKPGYYQSICKLADKRSKLIQYLPLADEPIGVHVDILPLDGEPEDDQEFIKHMNTLRKLHRHTLFIRYLKFSRMKAILYFLRHLKDLVMQISLNTANTYDRINSLVHLYDYEGSTYVGYITMSRYGLRQRHKRVLFEDSIDVEFEGHSFPAPKGYDEYLRNLFGDYMQLPPKEKRITSHIWTAYWKEG